MRKILETGDRIQCNTYIGHEIKEKRRGTIIGKNVCELYCVEFDEKFSGGHSGNKFKDLVTGKIIQGKNGYCWYLDESDLDFISSTNINRRIS
jgi:hypothetical protein